MSTPFLRVTSTYPFKQIPPSFAPELFDLRDVVPYKIVPQLMAAETADFERVAVWLLPEAEFVELNCGCPSPTCVGKGAGSSLLKDPLEFQRTVDELVRALGPGRLAIKMRTGFHCDQEFANLLAAVADEPLARLTVHGRTRADRYLGQARWSLIQKAALEAKAPVAASGDVLDQSSYKERSALAPAAESVMIGRGALRNPWIFLELDRMQQVEIEPKVLLLALASYGILHELAEAHWSKLTHLVKDGLLERAAETQVDLWEEVFRKLFFALFHQFPRLQALGHDLELPLQKTTLGRMKMLWNYLRSSLPTACFSPRVLRATSAGELLTGILGVTAGFNVLPLKYQSELDWIYAGGKSPPESL